MAKPLATALKVLFQAVWWLKKYAGHTTREKPLYPRVFNGFTMG
jgi:hypothetical protein